MLDLDGDNRVDFHEFYAATIDHQKLFTKETIKCLFEVLNIDQTDVITLKNFLTILPTNCNKDGIRRNAHCGRFFQINEIDFKQDYELVKSRWRDMLKMVLGVKLDNISGEPCITKDAFE